MGNMTLVKRSGFTLGIFAGVYYQPVRYVRRCARVHAACVCVRALEEARVGAMRVSVLFESLVIVLMGGEKTM